MKVRVAILYVRAENRNLFFFVSVSSFSRHNLVSPAPGGFNARASKTRILYFRHNFENRLLFIFNRFMLPFCSVSLSLFTSDRMFCNACLFLLIFHTIPASAVESFQFSCWFQTLPFQLNCRLKDSFKSVPLLGVLPLDTGDISSLRQFGMTEEIVKKTFSESLYLKKPESPQARDCRLLRTTSLSSVN